MKEIEFLSGTEPSGSLPDQMRESSRESNHTGLFGRYPVFRPVPAATQIKSVYKDRARRGFVKMVADLGLAFGLEGPLLAPIHFSGRQHQILNDIRAARLIVLGDGHSWLREHFLLVAGSRRRNLQHG